MKTVAILAIIGVASLALFSLSSGVQSDTESQFQDFLSAYGRNYGSESEYQTRLSVFAENLNTIERLNIENPRATFAVNEFADRTSEEMTLRRGFNGSDKTVKRAAYSADITAKSSDWTKMWTSVKNQGQCGSCWAFSAAAAFEARYTLSKGGKVTEESYAEQELVDCEPQSDGCEGGLMDFAFEYLQKKSFCTTAQYPYTAKDESCKDTKCAGGPTDKAFKDVPEGDENALLTELANGPVAIAVDANTWSFYSGGVLDKCGEDLDHGVTLVQYNAEKGFAKIRNSWGGSWGEEGHILIAVGSNLCGYANAASVPTF